MEYRRMGGTGLQLSELSFGSWLTFAKQIKDNTAEECMAYAYDNGINFFDNAEIYSKGKSEEVMGKILKKMGWDRSTYVVSSKVFWGGDLPNQSGLSRKHIMEGFEASARRLQMDYLDLFFCHRPDKNTPIEETVRAMNDLITQGKILYWGTSEWSAQEIQEAYGVARQYNLVPPSMEQPQYNMLTRDKFEVEYKQLYKNIGLGTTVWSPLASGLLTGKHNKKLQEATRFGIDGLDWLKDRLYQKENIDRVIALDAFAKELGIPTAALALLWVLKNPNVSTAITGASKVEQVKLNIDALEYKPLITNEVMEKIEGILDNAPEHPQF